MIARAFVVPVLIALLAVPPLAAAAESPACTQGSEGAADPAGIYVTPVSGHSAQYDVWRESNGLEGLQEKECRAADGSIAPADHRVGRVGVDTGGLPICVPRLGCLW